MDVALKPLEDLNAGPPVVARHASVHGALRARLHGRAKVDPRGACAISVVARIVKHRDVASPAPDRAIQRSEVAVGVPRSTPVRARVAPLEQLVRALVPRRRSAALANSKTRSILPVASHRENKKGVAERLAYFRDT